MTSNNSGDDKDLDDLMQAMTAATPAPDPAVRRDHIALAEQTFDDLHSARAAAPTQAKPGFLALLTRFGGKGGLGAATAVVAGGFVLLSPAGQDLWRTDTLLGTPEAAVASQADVQDPPAIAQEQSSEALLDTMSAAETESPTPEEVLEPLASIETEEDPVMAGDDGIEDGLAGSSLINRLEIEPDMAEAPVELRSFDEADTAVEFDPSQEESADMDMPEEAPLGLNEVPQAAPQDQGLVVGGIALEQQDAPTADQRVGGYAVEIVEPPAQAISPQVDIEAFANDRPSDVIITADEPVSTFSIDVDTASYAIVRQSIMSGVLPPRDAVRIEEMVNYFSYDYAAPDRDADRPFEPTVSVMQTPWNEGTQLVHIGLQGILPDIDARPALNLVFLIDTSGSMNQPNKLPLLRQSFMLMLNELRPEDEVAIVTYAGSAGLALPSTPASDRATIMAALNQLDAGGSTNGVGGLQQAYDVAATMTEDGEVSRVILATDGDFNIGLSDPAALEDYIAAQRDTGVFLSVLGFGRGNLNDATMQALAQNGNGTAAYIDTLNEAQKVLVDQLTGALFAIAADVKVQVEWNPGIIGEYRLIGYETRALEREDFNNDQVDAGELGAGHSVTAIYEVTPVGSPALLNDALRYQPEQVLSDSSEMGFLRLRWKDPGADESQLYEVPIVASETAQISTEAQFATAIAGFGQLLRDDRYLGSWGWDEAIALANTAISDDPFGYRREALQLMRLAQSLSTLGVSQD